eukprot:CAMPEP_0118986218 /NCGR_PEP_ID=MMETSP1173-20130426/41680_1 /TAXON_ID=1034831 /ORGANISM="Rhizochromulina marina cf, Strain CCMP1243" /LENGTH=83 /DNA_ID=CAMNT_0006936985 /DNA_START=311 /DNA_END=558 /DNA_ORIENTATION=-
MKSEDRRVGALALVHHLPRPEEPKAGDLNHTARFADRLGLHLQEAETLLPVPKFQTLYRRQDVLKALTVPYGERDDPQLAVSA